MTITVFIADDHVIMREGLTQVLQSHAGFEIVGNAGNGRETVQQVVDLKPQVVIMDISMPDMNGIEAARQIHNSVPDTHIIILSMHSTPEYVFQALEAGVRGYILKESAGLDIVNAVQVVQSGRRFLSPKVASIVADQIAMRSKVSPLNSLSKREREILQLVSEGRSSAKIADVLHLSPKTVDSYRIRLMQKLNITEITGLVKFAILNGLVPLE